MVVLGPLDPPVQRSTVDHRQGAAVRRCQGDPSGAPVSLAWNWDPRREPLKLHTAHEFYLPPGESREGQHNRCPSEDGQGVPLRVALLLPCSEHRAVLQTPFVARSGRGSSPDQDMCPWLVGHSLGRLWTSEPEDGALSATAGPAVAQQRPLPQSSDIDEFADEPSVAQRAVGMAWISGGRVREVTPAAGSVRTALLLVPQLLGFALGACLFHKH